jgi:hypothetical protein
MFNIKKERLNKENLIMSEDKVGICVSTILNVKTEEVGVIFGIPLDDDWIVLESKFYTLEGDDCKKYMMERNNKNNTIVHAV